MPAMASSTTTARNGSTLSRRAASKKSIGRRLAVERETSDIEPVDPRVEELRYTGCLEHRRAIVAGGDDGGLDRSNQTSIHNRHPNQSRLDLVNFDHSQCFRIFDASKIIRR
jgi:hypothetical protein